MSATWVNPVSSASTVADTASALASMIGPRRPLKPPVERRNAAWNAADRLPGDPAGLVSLDAEELPLLHPADQRLLDDLGLAPDHPLGDDRGGSDRTLDQPGRGNPGEAGALLQQRLLEVAAGNADLLAQGEDIVGREVLADVALGGLQLRGPLDDPLQRGPVEPGRRSLGHANPGAASATRR